MQILEKRSQRHGGNRALAGRNKAEQSDDTEALLMRQALWLCRHHPLSFEAAITLAQIAYARRPS
jgi:hypothetical protein